MSTLLEIKTAVANIFEKSVSELTINGQDMFLVAVNQVRRQAELMHDFEFQRKLVTVSVNGVTGGSLDTAVEYGTTTTVAIKSVIEVGLFDTNANLRPAEWTTVAESLERQRATNRRTTPRYPTDAWYDSIPHGQNVFELSGALVRRWPKDVDNNFTLGLEVYAFSLDWPLIDPIATVTGVTDPSSMNETYTVIGLWRDYLLYSCATSNTATVPYFMYNQSPGGWALGSSLGNFDVSPKGVLPSTSTSPAGTYTPDAGLTGTPVVTVVEGTSSANDIWTTYASEYLIWGCVCYLNAIFQKFVFRQEGGVPAPEKQRDAALAAFIAWDAAKYETNRRHGR